MEPASPGQQSSGPVSPEIEAENSAQTSVQLIIGGTSGEVPFSAQLGSSTAQPHYSPAAYQQQTVPIARFRPTFVANAAAKLSVSEYRLNGPASVVGVVRRIYNVMELL